MREGKRKYYPEIDPKIYESLYLDYYDTGIYLIKNGKLINKDFLSFINKVRNKFHKEIKIMGENATFIKLCNLCEKEKKVVNVYKIIKPQKEDDIKLLNDYYDILKKQAIQEIRITMLREGGWEPAPFTPSLERLRKEIP